MFSQSLFHFIQVKPKQKEVCAVPLIFHLSSLGIHPKTPRILYDLAKDIAAQKPDLVVVTGNIVKKATSENYKAAQEFLDIFQSPILCVSGSSDLSMVAKGVSMFDPFKLYRNHISPTQDVVHEDNDLFVVGINSARAVLPHWNWSNGMVSQYQLKFVHTQFRYAPNEKIRIFACHHPLVRTKGRSKKSIVWGSTDLLHALLDQHVDIVLSDSLNGVMFLPEHDGDKSPMMIGCAGVTNDKAILRVEYNVLHVTPDKINIELMSYDGANHFVLDNHVKERPLEEPPQDDDIF